MRAQPIQDAANSHVLRTIAFFKCSHCRKVEPSPCPAFQHTDLDKHTIALHANTSLPSCYGDVPVERHDICAQCTSTHLPHSSIKPRCIHSIASRHIQPAHRRGSENSSRAIFSLAMKCWLRTSGQYNRTGSVMHMTTKTESFS